MLEKTNSLASITKGCVDKQPGRVPTCIHGLDEILLDGLVRIRAYLVRGGPRCDGTTFGFQVSKQQRGCGRAMLITLAGRVAQIHENAAIWAQP
jgi:KaiC/GvpD/RAD55 family RecA-like ATPase